MELHLDRVNSTLDIMRGRKLCLSQQSSWGHSKFENISVLNVLFLSGMTS
jgi:hypothetical protein